MKELTPNEAYDLYVGMVTVDEFLAPFDGNVDQAVDQLMVEKWWSGEGDNYPENLPDLIKDYVVNQESIAFFNLEEELSYRYGD